METKTLIWIGLTVGGIAGSALGALLDGGLGLWTILFSTVGGILGIWIGYKLGQS